MCSHRSDTPLRVPGFPIRTSTDRSLVGSSPWLFAASHVLLRLQTPRHPPLALCSLENKDARARYGILKGRAAPRQRRNELGGGRTDAREADRLIDGRHRDGSDIAVTPSRRNREVRDPPAARNTGPAG